MSFIGNLIWFIFGGVWLALGWFVVGVLWCITIIGIPVGVQCFKFARLALSPFGKDVVYGYGAFSFIINVFWIIFGGIQLALGFSILGFLLCLTIIGIPFGLQCFKFAKLALFPLGARIVRI
ncbi:YccF domain-containing protein [Erysipelotrichaceae bacterium OH741_COT-311]|nr:YccF domain-containing protein [Erysipelotrichaceae bacterium OH741_COT-311]